MIGRIESTEEYLVEVFKALSDPLRLDIMKRMAQTDELACTELERALPVTKSTISYHVKILAQAGLLEVRKAGRYYHYRARRDLIDPVLPDLWDRIASLETTA